MLLLLLLFRTLYQTNTYNTVRALYQAPRTFVAQDHSEGGLTTVAAGTSSDKCEAMQDPGRAGAFTFQEP